MTRAKYGDIAVGGLLRNNDPRVTGDKKVVTVKTVEQYGVTYWTGTRTASIKYERIFTDGKERHQGYNLVAKLGYDYGIGG